MTKTEVFIDRLSGGNEPFRVLPEIGSRDIALRCVAFSPKGTILATGDSDGVVTIRQSDGGGQVLRLAHEGPILKLGFSPNGRVLAALGQPRGRKCLRVSFVSGLQRTGIKMSRTLSARHLRRHDASVGE